MRKKKYVSIIGKTIKSKKFKAFDTLHKSLMYNKNNNGPKINPWGKCSTLILKYLKEEL